MKQEKFKFIDLFAGIGGFHLAMHALGGECVFASEIDQYARQTYIHNFQKISPQLFKAGLFNSDIRQIVPDEIPDFDVLCAGFPCQPFSQAGYKRGFNDSHNSERGNLFFNIADILEVKRPKAYFLENVQGLVNHDQGKTFKLIRQVLELDLGYSFYYQIVKAPDYGLPQLRPRIFIVGFRDEEFFKGFNFPEKLPLEFNMSDVWGGVCSRKIGFTLRVGGRGSNINDRRNWDSYLVDGTVRQLTHVEAKKMQGFSDNFEFPVSSTQAIKQLGNSVAVNAVRAVGKNIITYMSSLESNQIELTLIKGDTSSQKADIFLDIHNEILTKNNEGFGIKSYLGSKPTLLNASGNTNFIFEIENLAKDKVDEINAINTKTKLTDRIKAIEKYGGRFKYIAPEKKAMEYNLKMVYFLMPEVIGSILIVFYKYRISSIAKIIDYIHENTNLINELQYEDKTFLVNKIKKFLVDVLLGFFAGSKWDGSYEANGTIIVKESGEQVAFHIIDLDSLQSYLYNNIKLDTPSTTRHRYGRIIRENDKKLYFKLNLQLRF
ncbi:MAG: HpaII family restriction endonuclease [Waterburya sp.]